ncbi:FAD-dependent monooxygenase [Breoghania sp. L-A4]|uniref:FAD-dependent oxidoreductase n=1 Tax=Breoghania sp. L-A4 TaxID=2304600 RepID=UPI0013C30CAC|nr:FAD-dependent monooxygenase [Breoghania sp. L-A4]
MNILVVGAGPTGLTAAVELARQGIVPVVAEKRPEGSGLSRAVGILPESLELLAPSGTAQALLRKAMRIERAKIFLGDTLKVTLPLDISDDLHDTAVALPQDRTEEILRERLAAFGGAVSFDREVVDITQNATGVDVSFANGRRQRADYVIAADGVHSRIRTALGIAYGGRDIEEIWSIADVNARDWPHDRSFVLARANTGHMAVVAHMAPQRYRVVSNTPDALKSLRLPMDVTRINRQGQFHLAARQAKRYQMGRVFLAGDAAHCHSPVGGRGMNLGIADAADLARRLIADDLDGYHDARHAAGAKILAETERLRLFLSSSRAVNTLTIRAALTLAGALPPLRRRIANRFLHG